MVNIRTERKSIRLNQKSKAKRGIKKKKKKGEEKETQDPTPEGNTGSAQGADPSTSRRNISVYRRDKDGAEKDTSG